MIQNHSYLGFGLGLRSPHYAEILAGAPRVDWFEALTENYLGRTGSGAGRPLRTLLKIREKFPVVLHGVSLSIGTTDPINFDYLKRLKKLAQQIEPTWISDHLCWTSFGGHNAHDLLPLPYTEEALDHICGRIRIVEDFLERPIILENVSSYAEFETSTLTESAFIRELCARSGTKLLLDLNNIYVSSVNHHFDPLLYLNEIPKDRVQQFHLAGHTNRGHFLIDTHDHPIVDPVWDLYRSALERFGKISTMIEWDSEIPSLSELVNELDKARSIAGELKNAA